MPRLTLKSGGERTSSAPGAQLSTISKRRLFSARAALFTLLGFASSVFAGFLLYRLWPRTISVRPPRPDLAWMADENGQQTLSVRGRVLLGVVGNYDDELYAYLMFDWVRSRAAAARQFLLTYSEERGNPKYRIQMVCPDGNLLVCIPELSQLRWAGLLQTPSWVYLRPEAARRYQDQTKIFIQAYTGPVEDRFKHLSRRDRIRYVRRFIRFKSETDPRVLRRDRSAPHPLTEEQASQLAGDVIAVADFYSLPLNLFLGIGAMENNYINVRGDLDHVIWKRRKAPGDIVVRRGRKGYLVRNPSAGVWQITRETLRHAHALFLADKRDYSKLPERLRPDHTLNVDNVKPAALTTYAGLLLRHLVDFFHGDVAKAVGAYNGGTGNPNENYEAGVRRVADYAGRILGRAAVSNKTLLAAETMPKSARQ